MLLPVPDTTGIGVGVVDFEVDGHLEGMRKVGDDIET